MSKKFWISVGIAIILFCVGMAFLKIFPDPYHKEDAVDLWTWIYRELEEVLHGEHIAFATEEPCD